MNADQMLIEAQMHLECMNEAFLEIERGEADEDRQRVVYAELLARLWASIHLVQSVRLGREDEGLVEALREARCYNNVDDAPAQDDLH
jgi:hypothetical protein